MKKIIYVGSFDPAHYGHLDTYKNICKLFPEEKIIVVICRNDLKEEGILSIEERKVVAEDLFKTDIVIAENMEEVCSIIREADYVGRGARNEKDKEYDEKLFIHYNLENEKEKLVYTKIKPEFWDYSSSYIRANIFTDKKKVKNMISPLAMKIIQNKYNL